MAVQSTTNEGQVAKAAEGLGRTVPDSHQTQRRGLSDPATPQHQDEDRECDPAVTLP